MTRLGRHPWLVAVLAFVIQMVPTLVYYARTGGESDGSVLADLWPGLVVAAVLLVGLVFGARVGAPGRADETVGRVVEVVRAPRGVGGWPRGGWASLWMG